MQSVSRVRAAHLSQLPAAPVVLARGACAAHRPDRADVAHSAFHSAPVFPSRRNLASGFPGHAAGGAGPSISPRSPSSLTRGFSASADGSGLADVLKQELKFEKENYVPPQKGSGPPSPFKLVSQPGDCQMVLTRTFNQEEISINFSANDEDDFFSSLPDDNGEGEEGEAGEDADALEPPPPQANFTVHINKPSMPDTLTFECTTDGSTVEVHKVTLDTQLNEESESMPAIPYDGPNYTMLDDILKEEFHGFLVARGINEELGRYIMDAREDKEQTEYMGWLKRVHAFVKA
eukprot:jgi/Mesvir1/16372/Mv18119-RA.1